MQGMLSMEMGILAKKIMIIDDDLKFSDLASSFLRSAGYDVIRFSEGRGAAENAASEKPDLIILDIYLPDLNGFSVLKHLRCDPTTRGTPIIVCSGAIEFVRQQGELLDQVNVEILEKPFALRELLAKVERATGKR